MDSANLSRRYPPAILGLAGLLAGMSVSADARSAHRKDSETCASFGAHYGTPEYSRCMLAQQRRRDVAPLQAAEQQRLSAETARSNLEMVRRIRCERAAKRDREQGVPPRYC